MSKHIVIPDERAVQLKRYADARGLTLADAVGDLLNRAIEAGDLPDEIPGFEITRNGEKVDIDAGVWKASLGTDLAKAYAAQVREISDALRPRMADLGLPLDAIRRGDGIRLTAKDRDAIRTVSRSVARDIARLIEMAAK